MAVLFACHVLIIPSSNVCRKLEKPNCKALQLALLSIIFNFQETEYYSLNIMFFFDNFIANAFI